MRKLGWRPDPPKLAGQAPDYDAHHILAGAPIPPSASVKHYVTSVLDQGQLGSCVANAIAQAVRISHVRQGWLDPYPASRLMMYYCSRAKDGDVSQDAGTFLRSCFSVLDKFGFCPEAKWPYDVSRFAEMPPAAAFRAAFDQHSPTVYQRINTAGTARTDDIKRAIASGYAVAFGTDVSEAFTRAEGIDGIIEPPLSEPIAGGHALCVVGYDGDAFEICNSWGPDFGDGGFIRFSGNYMRWSTTNDLWIVASAPRYSS